MIETTAGFAPRRAEGTERVGGEASVHDVHQLRERFFRAARAAGAAEPSDGVFEELVARYREPHRRYHTLAHVDRCLAWLDWFSGSAERPHEVELAL
jgi:hypothetical protein